MDIDSIDTPAPSLPKSSVQPGVDYPFKQGYDDININDNNTSIDICFIMDSTGSMGSYLDNATKNVQEICDSIIKSEKLQGPHALRIGLISYRDHPPQDYTYILKNFGFTHDIEQMRDNLKSLYASGGGDGPEAVTSALSDAINNMPWRANSSKMAVLVADAPPHGIGEYGDGFPNGSPCGNDPLQLARLMASNSITLFVVACEPALSGYQFSTDFFKALADLTGGMMIPLVSANLWVIIGSALEQMDIERLIKEVGGAVAERVHGANESVDDVAKALHETLMLRNENTKKIVVENIYRESDEANHNYEVWKNASAVTEGKSLTKRVPGSRFTDKYLSMRYSTPPPSYSFTGSGPPLPSRKDTPSRKTLSSFATFNADSKLSNASIMNTPVGNTGNTATSFSGIDTSSRRINDDDMDDDDDDDDDDKIIDDQLGATQNDDSESDDDNIDGIQFKRGAITYDQARRITTASAWRSAMSYR